MSASRILPCLIIILVSAVIGAGIGTALQALRITDRPQEFRSLAKLVAGGTMVYHEHDDWREQQEDLYGTIIETLNSAEMSRRALERVRALNPDIKDCDVKIRAFRTKGSAIFNILATGPEPRYTRIFLDALLDEFIAFRQSIREQGQGKVLQQFLQEVVTHQKDLEDALAALEKVRAKVGKESAESDQERLVARLNPLRNQGDDLRLKLKPMAENDASRTPLQSQLSAIESELQGIESDLQRLEPGLSELRTVTQKYEMRKMGYEKLFEAVEQLQSVFNSRSDYVAIQERATPAAEYVEDWHLPIALGASGGLLGGLIGLVLSLIFIQAPKPPQVSTVVG